MIIPIPSEPKSEPGHHRDGRTGAVPDSRATRPQGPPAVATRRSIRVKTMASTPSTAGAGPRSKAGSGTPEPQIHSGSFAVLSAARTGCAAARPHCLALRIDPESEGFCLAILDAEHRTLLTLGSYPEQEAVAAWHRLGLAAGLALAIEGPDGSVEVPYPQLGRVRLGPVRVRRRHALLSGRRPRFLTRRKTAHFPPRPRVHREPEIAGGFGD
jgi:hypothetical protein